jgi:hypothetical protein
MSAQMKQVDKMFSRLSGAGKDILDAGKEALKSSTVQMILGAVLILYISFLESESDSVLSLALSNPLGRIIILLLLVVLAYANPVLGVLFVVLIVMSFVSVGSVSGFADSGSGCSASLPVGYEGFQDMSKPQSPAEQGTISPAPGSELESDVEKLKEEASDGKKMGGLSFLSSEGFMNFQDSEPTPADGKKEKPEGEAEAGAEGFLSANGGKKEYSLYR